MHSGRSELNAPLDSPRFRFSFSAFLHSPSAAVLAAFLVRFLAIWFSRMHEDVPHRHFATVGMEAVMISHSLATGQGFANPFPHYPYVTAWLAPVYPWLLSLSELVFRLDSPFVGIFAAFLNSFFSVLTCYPIYYLGKKIFSARIGLGAAWLWAFLPIAVIMPIEWVWDQSLSALLLALLLCFTYYLRESSSALHWSAYGLLWGVAALSNPTLCLLLPFLGLWLWLQRRKSHRPSLQLFARLALFLALALIPWTLRNWIEVGGFTLVKSNLGLELWLGNNPKVTDVFTLYYHPSGNYREYRLLVLKGEPAYNRIKAHDALAFIQANPGTFFKLCFHRFVDTWTGKYDSTDDTYVQTLGIAEIYLWFTAAFSIVAFVGLFFALRTNPWESLPLAFCLILFPIPYYVTHSSLRYRHPIDPMLTIVAVWGVSRSWVFLSKYAQSFSSTATKGERQGPVTA